MTRTPHPTRQAPAHIAPYQKTGLKTHASTNPTSTACSVVKACHLPHGPGGGIAPADCAAISWKSVVGD